MGYPFFVVLSRPRMLYCFPCEDISNRIVTPSPQTGEVYVSVGGSERLAHKRHIVAVEEVVRDVGRLMWRFGEFGISSDVYTMEYNFTIISVAEAGTLDEEDRRHCGDGRLEKIHGRKRRKKEGEREKRRLCLGAKRGVFVEVIALWSQACEQCNVIWCGCHQWVR
jgi:hypothetical protein